MSCQYNTNGRNCVNKNMKVRMWGVKCIFYKMQFQCPNYTMRETKEGEKILL
jgi:hypothetical protein